MAYRSKRLISRSTPSSACSPNFCRLRSSSRNQSRSVLAVKSRAITSWSCSAFRGAGALPMSEVWSAMKSFISCVCLSGMGTVLRATRISQKERISRWRSTYIQ